MTAITVLEAIDELEGLVPPDVGRALYRFAGHVDPSMAILEIGSFRGKSTCYLAAGARARRGAHVWAVDPWNLAGNVNGKHGFASPSVRRLFDSQLRTIGLEQRITPIQGFSVTVAPTWEGPLIGLLFIDGDHSYDAVKADFIAWERHLFAGATVLFDDWDTPKNPGVRKAVEELVMDGELEEPVIVAGRLAWCQR